MFDHYIAVDWSQKIMAIAYFCTKSSETKTFEVRSDLKVLKAFIEKLEGSKILTVEEGNQAQWLYVELKAILDEIIICDPYRNSLLKDGPKNDTNDALKLLQLLKAGLLKPVFHCNDDLIYMRHLVTGYENLVTSGVKIKNQMKALISAKVPNKDPYHKFVLRSLNEQISQYESEKARYKNEFISLSKKNRPVRILKSVPGIGPVGSIKLASRIVYPKRFQSKGHFLSYCGLIKLDKVSGGKSYGKKMSRHSRQLKAVFKTAAMAIINGDENCILNKFYKDQIENGLAEFQARHALARRVAVLALGTLKSNEEFNVRKIKV